MTTKISTKHTWKNRNNETIQDFFERQKQQLLALVGSERTVDALLLGVNIEPYWLDCADLKVHKVACLKCGGKGFYMSGYDRNVCKVCQGRGFNFALLR